MHLPLRTSKFGRMAGSRADGRGIQISTGMAPGERGGGHAFKIAKWNRGISY